MSTCVALSLWVGGARPCESPGSMSLPPSWSTQHAVSELTSCWPLLTKPPRSDQLQPVRRTATPGFPVRNARVPTSPELVSTQRRWRGHILGRLTAGRPRLRGRFTALRPVDGARDSFERSREDDVSPITRVQRNTVGTDASAPPFTPRSARQRRALCLSVSVVVPGRKAADSSRFEGDVGDPILSFSRRGAPR